MSQTGMDAARRGVGVDDGAKVFLVLFIMAVVSSVLWLFVIPPIVNGSRLSTAATEAKVHDLEDGYIFDDKVDWWGNKIQITRVMNADKTAITYTAVSAGKDGIPGNGDDLSKFVIDFNKSKIIGKWVGEKSKQAVKGMKEGIKAKSKFE